MRRCQNRFDRPLHIHSWKRSHLPFVGFRRMPRWQRSRLHCWQLRFKTLSCKKEKLWSEMQKQCETGNRLKNQAAISTRPRVHHQWAQPPHQKNAPGGKALKFWKTICASVQISWAKAQFSALGNANNQHWLLSRDFFSILPPISPWCPVRTESNFPPLQDWIMRRSYQPSSHLLQLPTQTFFVDRSDVFLRTIFLAHQRHQINLPSFSSQASLCPSLALPWISLLTP